MKKVISVEIEKDQRVLVCRGRVQWKLTLSLQNGPDDTREYWFPTNAELADVLHRLGLRYDERDKS